MLFPFRDGLLYAEALCCLVTTQINSHSNPIPKHKPFYPRAYIIKPQRYQSIRRLRLLTTTILGTFYGVLKPSRSKPPNVFWVSISQLFSRTTMMTLMLKRFTPTITWITPLRNDISLFSTNIFK